MYVLGVVQIVMGNITATPYRPPRISAALREVQTLWDDFYGRGKQWREKALGEDFGEFMAKVRSDDDDDDDAVVAAPQQAAMAHMVDQDRYRSLIAGPLRRDLTAADVARLRSAAGPYAARWLSVYPTAPRLRIDNSNFQVACRMRVGIPLAGHTSWSNGKCQLCDVQLDPSEDGLLGHHAMRCKDQSVGSAIWRHDFMRDVWRDCIAAAGVPTGPVEPWVRRGGTEPGYRADLQSFPGHGMNARYYDVRLCDATNTSVRAEAQYKTGLTAERCEEIKRKKAESACEERGREFVPLVFEHGGAWGGAAVKQIRELAVLAEQKVGASSQAFIRFWTSFISITLVCNTVAYSVGNYCNRANTATMEGRWGLEDGDECGPGTAGAAFADARAAGLVDLLARCVPTEGNMTWASREGGDAGGDAGGTGVWWGTAEGVSPSG